MRILKRKSSLSFHSNHLIRNGPGFPSQSQVSTFLLPNTDVMLLANDNPKFDEVDSTTIDGGDSQGAPAFLATHASEVSQVYLLGDRIE